MEFLLKNMKWLFDAIDAVPGHFDRIYSLVRCISAIRFSGTSGIVHCKRQHPKDHPGDGQAGNPSMFITLSWWIVVQCESRRFLLLLQPGGVHFGWTHVVGDNGLCSLSDSTVDQLGASFGEHSLQDWFDFQIWGRGIWFGLLHGTTRHDAHAVRRGQVRFVHPIDARKNRNLDKSVPDDEDACDEEVFVKQAKDPFQQRYRK